MAEVVACASLGLARTHREQRLRPLQRLDLGLLVDTEHDGMVGWIHVEPYDVAHLLDEGLAVCALRSESSACASLSPPLQRAFMRGFARVAREW